MAQEAKKNTPQDKKKPLLSQKEVGSNEERIPAEQFDLDAAMWYGAIKTGTYADAIRRLFHFFYYAGVMYKVRDGWQDWAKSNGNVASLLSHGQRVLVQIPTLTNGGDKVWRWLNTKNGIPQRKFATHGVAVKDHPAPLLPGHVQYVKETKGYGASFKGWALNRQYAFNVPLGGTGNRNPFSASNNAFDFVPIKEDGLNGHVFIHYLPPTNSECGAMLVGCENAEHGRGQNPHTKAGHGMGGHAQKVSACGGKKWSELKDIGPVDEYNGFICDLVCYTDIERPLGYPLFDPEWLDGKTMMVATPPPPKHKAPNKPLPPLPPLPHGALKHTPPNKPLPPLPQGAH